MLKTLNISFRLKSTYRANSIIYAIRQLPILKKYLSDRLYKNKKIKLFAYCLGILWEIISIFLGKSIYLAVMILAVLPFYPTAAKDTFVHLLTFLTLCGGVLNTYMLNPTKDKYYAIILMKMDARAFALTNYDYQLGKLLIGFFPLLVLFGSFYQVPLWTSLLFPFFILSFKLIFLAYSLYTFKKTQHAANENLPAPIVWGFVAICLLLGYGLPALGITINLTALDYVQVLTILIGLYCFIQIHRFQDYPRMYRQILTEKNVYMQENNSGTKAIQANTLKQIELDTNDTSQRFGFAYFHELFVKRHRKILTGAVKKQTVVIIFILLVLMIGVLVNDVFKSVINRFLMAGLPYFVFIMYSLNRSASATQAMFMNCDHSMLTYRIYRTPKVILGIFKQRLKTLVMINLWPAMIIALGLPILLYLSGGTPTPWHYIILPVSIIAMSIFFSTHYLVMYYLLQPYNVHTEIKSSTYSVIQFLTYLVCWGMIQIQLPTFYFGLTTIIFCLAYTLLALLLVYRYAPKTFKLRL